MLPTSWKPAPHRLIRLGSPNDGGYLVSPMAVEASAFLLSMGLGDDWSFEADFRRLNPVPVLCLDHTVNARFWIKRALASGNPFRWLAYKRFFRGQVRHRKERVTYGTLGRLLRKIEGPVFLKCDIEGAEYRILSDLAANAHRFTGIVMEFHDIDLHRDRITRLLGFLPGFRVVALHANNYGGTDETGDPLVLEMTLTRRDLAGDRVIAATRASPNDPARREIALRFEGERRAAA